MLQNTEIDVYFEHENWVISRIKIPANFSDKMEYV
jgi:hypothetical protein